MKKQLTYIAVAFLFSGLVSAQNIDLNAMPKAGPTPTINIQKPKTFQLENGMTVMVVENHKLPRVTVSLQMDNPPYVEGKIAGVSSIMADQLDKGTQKTSKDDFNEKVDYLGARLGFSSNGAYANSLSKYFPQVLELMAEAIVHPKFRAEEVQTSKQREIEGLKSMEKSADAIASRVSNALTYGKNTALGEFTTEESINNIQLADVENNYKNHYIPNNAYLVIVGDVKFDEIKPMIEKSFADWKKSDTKYEVPKPAQNVAKTEIDIVDVPTAVQSVVSVGNLTDLKMNNPHYFAATLGNYILGGGADSRLFMNLREKNGYTYGAYSGLSARKYNSFFSANASVRNEVTDKAVQEFMNELKGFTSVTPEELESAKAKLKGSFILSLEQPATIASFAVNEKTQNLPEDFYKNYLKSIDAVTAADISNVAKEYILPNQTRIFVAGKASEIADGLEKLGYPVNYYDNMANKTTKPEVKKVDANTTISTIGENYIKAIGGAKKVAAINSAKMIATANVQGMEMQMENTTAKGGKTLIEVKMMGNTMQKIVFDGKDGFMEGQGQKIPLPEEQKKGFLANTEVFPELNYGKSDTYQLSGIEKYNDEDAYAVKSGEKTIYYSVKSGLKIGEVQSTPQGAIPTTYSDYREVNGVKMPFKISQNMGGMDITFDVQSYEFNTAKDSDFK